MPLATEVLAGERAEEGLDSPSIARLRAGVQPPGLLWGGAGKRRAWDPRASLARHQAWSVSPWPLPGATAAALDAWSTMGGTKGEAGAFTRRGRPTDRGHAVRAAEG